MYKEVALNPECMADMDYYRLLKQHFGFEKGRYVSADIRAWVAEAMQIVKTSNLQPVRQKSVKNYLNKLGRGRHDKHAFILPKDRERITADNWNNWLTAQIAQRKFSLIVSNKAIEGSINIEQIDDGNEAWEIPASVDVLRNADDIVNALEPMIAISINLTIIDPYFRLTKNGTLVKLLQTEKCANLKRITIVTAMESPNAQSIFEREYQSLLKENIKFKWLKMPEKFFHERYAITEIGAIRSGPGFMENTLKEANSDYAPFNLISRVEADRALNDLSRLIEEKKAIEILSI